MAGWTIPYLPSVEPDIVAGSNLALRGDLVFNGVLLNAPLQFRNLLAVIARLNVLLAIQHFGW